MNKDIKIISKLFVNFAKKIYVYSQFSRCNTARGSDTGLVTVVSFNIVYSRIVNAQTHHLK